MGSGNSRMGSRPPRPRSDHRPKLNFAAFLCGGASTSSSPPQIEDQQSEKLALPARRLNDSKADDNLQGTVKKSPLTSESSSLCSLSENLSSSISVDDSLMESPTLSQSADTMDSGKYLSESKELVPCLSSGSSGLDITHSKRTRNIASTSSKAAHLEPLSTNINTNLAPVDEASEPINDSVSSPSDTSATEIHASGSSPNCASISLSTSNLLAEEPLLEASSSGADFLSVGEGRDGNILHVDVVSISSNILPSDMGDVNGNEARRNSRTQFWDAFSRRNRTRRNYDYPGMEDSDDIGSHDGWLLDIGDDLFGSRLDHDSVYLHRRNYGSNGRRWHSRSEIRERLRGGFQNDRGESSFCPSGLHPDGTCSCNSLFMNEESSTRASISRIVLLAETLFEVLHEIRHQPVFLSLSMVSLPAPESVVNSLPVKSHIKHDAAAVDDVEQCYICLAEYEKGDKIRVLPCRHEYHMSCVDKWLKEIHGVCPLCRQDVCEGTAEVTPEVTV